MDFNAVPANIQRLMRLLDVSPKHMAAVLGMSERTMYRRFKEPDTFTLGELAAVSKKFKIRFEKLLEAA